MSRRRTTAPRAPHPSTRQASARACTSLGSPEGKTAKNRVHLDVRPGTGLTGGERRETPHTESARLRSFGATQVHLPDADEDNGCTIVMQDIEGSEFCLD